MRKFILGLVISLGLVSGAWAANYDIDQAHSTLGFSIKHMMVSNTTGQFDKYEGKISYDPQNLAASKIEITIQVASINTRNDQRDEHLRKPEFFDAAKFPTITFVSKKITATEIVGDLTMKGVTKEIAIPATITGPINGMMGKKVIGINADFTVNRQDYGISFNKTLDQGGLAVANDVKVSVSIEADEAAAAAAPAAAPATNK